MWNKESTLDYYKLTNSKSEKVATLWHDLTTEEWYVVFRNQRYVFDAANEEEAFLQATAKINNWCNDIFKQFSAIQDNLPDLNTMIAQTRERRYDDDEESN